MSWPVVSAEKRVSVDSIIIITYVHVHTCTCSRLHLSGGSMFVCTAVYYTTVHVPLAILDQILQSQQDHWFQAMSCNLVV